MASERTLVDIWPLVNALLPILVLHMLAWTASPRGVKVLGKIWAVDTETIVRRESS